MSDETEVPAWQLGRSEEGLADAAAPAEPAAPAFGPDDQARLDELLARKAAVEAAAEPMVSLKVEAPHAAMSFGGYTVGNEFQQVPARVAAGLHEAAASAGVTLTQEG